MQLQTVNTCKNDIAYVNMFVNKTKDFAYSLLQLTHRLQQVNYIMLSNDQNYIIIAKITKHLIINSLKLSYYNFIIIQN